MPEKRAPFHTEPCTFEKFISEANERICPERSWVFRGQKHKAFFREGKWKWALNTSFERACDRFEIPQKKRVKLEKKMIREFQRRLHLYDSNVPENTMTDEWLAIMQHYGVPTQLLDFTYSPYVAAYFAFEEAELDQELAIWALDAKWLDEQLDENYKELLRTRSSYEKNRKGKDFDTIFMSSKYQLVLTANPFRRNERIAYQKGVFLCPGDINIGFMDNLLVFKDKEGFDDHVIQYTIHINKAKTRDNVLRQLELMNINRNTLFPGLDGFAKSFTVKMVTLFPYI